MRFSNESHALQRSDLVVDADVRAAIVGKGGQRHGAANSLPLALVHQHLGHVVRVEGEGRNLKLGVEDARDLRRRTIDPGRRRVRRIDPEA